MLRHLPERFWFFLLLMTLSTNALAFSAYSNDELDQLEREFVQQINQSPEVIRNPLAIEYINQLAKRLAEHGEIATPYFFLVKSNEINAFAGPGGYIGVNSQLITATENESELAAVMAHEMSHVRQHHLYRMLEHQKQMRVPMLASMLASIALGVINPSLATGALLGTMSSFTQDNINFVRASEKEADSIGIDMLIKSGLDPRGMASFFKKMQQNARYYYTSNVPAILRTHPLDEERIAEAESRSQNLPKKSYPNHLEYRLFKELIRVEVSNHDRRLLAYYEQQCPKGNPNTACQYGYILTLLSMNQFYEARERLSPLLKGDPYNLFYAIAAADALEGLHQYASAVAGLRELQANFPDNYALMVKYGEALIAANKPAEAEYVFLKGHRRFKQDLPLCRQLASAFALNKNKGYAYFTLAECHMLQGERKYALGKLKLAKTFMPKDLILQARVDAKIDEIMAGSEK